MNTKEHFVTVPQIIRDECPLFDGFYFREETENHWAALRSEGDDSKWWISRNYDTGSYALHHWTRNKDINLHMPPETTHEELWRYVYAQFILGDDNA